MTLFLFSSNNDQIITNRWRGARAYALHGGEPAKLKMIGTLSGRAEVGSAFSTMKYIPAEVRPSC